MSNTYRFNRTDERLQPTRPSAYAFPRLLINGGSMTKKRIAKTKVVRINHGLFGNPNSRRIEKTIDKWARKGYTLQHQQAEGHGLRGYTLLTFREDLS